MAIKYHFKNFNPESLSQHNIDRMALEEVPRNSFVLDVGCATGFMGKYLKDKKKCEVVGLEKRKEEAHQAEKILNNVVIGDIENALVAKDILKVTKNKKFDVVLATSLIEHVAKPDEAIKTMMRLLKPHGRLVITTPNIAHWSIRLSLVKGNFDYSEYGILDTTHLHFFTLKTFKELFEKNGLQVKKVRIDAEGGGFPRLSLMLAPFFPGIFAYQILIVASLWQAES